MSNLPSPYESEEETEQETLEKFVQLRRKQCQALDTQILRHLMNVLQGDVTAASDLLVDGIASAYRSKMRIAMSDEYSTTIRGKAYKRVQKFHKDVDEHYDRYVAATTVAVGNNKNESSRPVAMMAVDSPPRKTAAAATPNHDPAAATTMTAQVNPLQTTVRAVLFDSLRTLQVETCRASVIQKLVAQGKKRADATRVLQVLNQHNDNATLSSLLTDEQLQSIFRFLNDSDDKTGTEALERQATVAANASGAATAMTTGQANNAAATSQNQSATTPVVVTTTATAACQSNNAATTRQDPMMEVELPSTNPPSVPPMATAVAQPHGLPEPSNDNAARKINAQTAANHSDNSSTPSSRSPSPVLLLPTPLSPGLPEGVWQCSKCSYLNQKQIEHCILCKASRNASLSTKSAAQTQVARFPKKYAAPGLKPLVQEYASRALAPVVPVTSQTTQSQSHLQIAPLVQQGHPQQSGNSGNGSSRATSRLDLAPSTTSRRSPFNTAAAPIASNTAFTSMESRSGSSRISAPNPASYVALPSTSTAVSGPPSAMRRESSLPVASAASSSVPGKSSDPTKQLTQDDIKYELQKSLTICKPSIKSHVQEVVLRHTIPRSRDKFINYAKTGLRLDREGAIEVWTHIESVMRTAAIEKEKTQSMKASQSRPLHSAPSSQSHPMRALGADVSTGSENRHLNQRGYRISPQPRPVSTHPRRSSDSNATITNERAPVRQATSETLGRGPPKKNQATASKSLEVTSRAQQEKQDVHSQTIVPQTQSSRSSRNASHIALPTGSNCTAKTTIVEFAVLEDPVFSSYANAYTSDTHPKEEPLRGDMTVQFYNVSVSEKTGQNIAVRIHDWEPFWEVVSYVKIFKTNQVLVPANNTSSRTAFSARLEMDSLAMYQRKLVGKIDIRADEWGKARTSSDYDDGETRLLFMMLPCSPPTKKKADGHLWPKGTFLQVRTLNDGHRDVQRVRLSQRKQDNLGDWKGMSKVFDLTQYISDPTRPAVVEGVAYDEEKYFGCVVYARYRSSKMLCKSLMNRDSPYSISFVDEELGAKRALSFATSNMIVIDSDDEKETHDEEAGKLIFSLTDAFSKTLMTEPVRGIKCKHFQCFDLANYISGNSFVSGNRWRCQVCELFVSWQELELCGYTKQMLQRFSDTASPRHDRIEVTSNGSYRLLDERSQRNNKRKATSQQPTLARGPSDHKKAKVVAETDIVDLL